jgi:hypothetical protein
VFSFSRASRSYLYYQIACTTPRKTLHESSGCVWIDTLTRSLNKFSRQSLNNFLRKRIFYALVALPRDLRADASPRMLCPTPKTRHVHQLIRSFGPGCEPDSRTLDGFRIPVYLDMPPLIAERVLRAKAVEDAVLMKRTRQQS